MRPPQNAGESVAVKPSSRSRTCGFNEAPAERGGKFVRLWAKLEEAHGFNEAPAERGGKCRRETVQPLAHVRLQ